MSVINTVLRELDLRHAVGAGERVPAPVPVRAVGARRPSRRRGVAFWVVPLVAAAAAWSFVPAHWLSPASRSMGERPQAGPATAHDPPVARVAADTVRDLTEGTASHEPARPGHEPRPDAIWGQPLPDVRKPPDAAATVEAVVPPVPKNGPESGPKHVAAATSDVPRHAAATVRAAPSAPGVTQPAPEPAGTIERRLRPLTPQERSDLAFRSGTRALQEGRVAEAEKRFRDALDLDPGSVAPREALLGVLLEAGRRAEARQLMTDGLQYAPAHATFALVAARLLVDEGDIAGALALLDRHDAAGSGNAEYQALAAGLLQRLGRHAEAVLRYSRALALGDDRAVWRMGRAISYRELGRTRESEDDFRRSLDSRALSPEVRRYVERQIEDLRAGG